MNQYTRRADANEGVIVEHLKTLKPPVIPQPIQAPAIGDLLVQFHLDAPTDGVMFCGTLEVKRPGKRKQLTDAQKLYQPAVESFGILYSIVTTPEEAEEAINTWRKRIRKFAKNYQRKTRR